MLSPTSASKAMTPRTSSPRSATGSWRSARGCGGPTFSRDSAAARREAVRLPDGGGARIVGVGGDRVLVGRGRPVRHARDPLDAAHAFVVRRERRAHGMQQGGDAGQREGAQQHVVNGIRQHRPQAGERNEQEHAGEAEHQPHARPQALEQQRPAADAHLAREFCVEGGSGLRLRHPGTIAGTLRRAKRRGRAPGIKIWSSRRGDDPMPASSHAWSGAILRVRT